MIKDQYAIHQVHVLQVAAAMFTVTIFSINLLAIIPFLIHIDLKIQATITLLWLVISIPQGIVFLIKMVLNSYMLHQNITILPITTQDF